MTKTELMTRLREQAKKLQGVEILDINGVFGKGVHEWQQSHVDATMLFIRNFEDIKKIRGLWKIEPKYSRYNDNSKLLEEVKIIAKPCKEFDQLNHYLNTYCGLRKLNYDDIYYKDVDGKRDSVWTNYQKLLCHQAQKCAKILKILRNSKASSYSCKLEFKRDNYWGDRFNSYGEDMECEWQGSQSRYAIIRLCSKKTGKELKTITISIY